MYYDENYRPSYLFLKEQKLIDANNGETTVNYDTLISRNENGECVYSAYGDGAHLKQILFRSDTNKEYTITDLAYHNMQLEELFNHSLELTAIRKGEVVFHYVAENNENK